MTASSHTGRNAIPTTLKILLVQISTERVRWVRDQSNGVSNTTHTLNRPASEHPTTEAKRQRAGERAAGQHQRAGDDGQTRDGPRRRERWIGRHCARYVRRHAVEVEEEPGRGIAQHERRQRRVGHNGAAWLGAWQKGRRRHPACHRWRDPEADKKDQARESIRDRNEHRKTSAVQPNYLSWRR